jgi:hypothetical protein
MYPPAMVGLVEDLAEYEKSRAQCTLTAEQLDAALFGPSPAVFAHVVEDETGVVGCAIWFLNYSTWTGVPDNHAQRANDARRTNSCVADETIRHGSGRIC